MFIVRGSCSLRNKTYNLIVYAETRQHIFMYNKSSSSPSYSIVYYSTKHDSMLTR